MNSTRPELRRQLQARRAALSPGQRLAAADAVARHLCAQPELREPGYVAGYWAVGGEVPLHAVQLRLAPAQVWCLPVLQDGGHLRFAPWRAGDPLVNNRFGIPEPDLAPASLLDPSQLTVAVMPLVGFDAFGQRLGMGGGWYDRTFAFRHERLAPPYLVGAAFDVQRVESLTGAAWDVAVDAVCTETTFIDCRKIPA